MNLLENHDISFRRNEFLVYIAEGHERRVPLRHSPSGHRILNLLLQGQHTASCLSHATASDFSEDSREQNFERTISIHVCGFVSTQIPLRGFVSTQVLHPVNSHRTWSIPVSTQSDFAVFS